MSQSQSFAANVLGNLGASGVLQGIFAKVLAKQIKIDKNGAVTLDNSFSTLLKVFSFISTPAVDRPVKGLIAYTDSVLEVSKKQAAKADPKLKVTINEKLIVKEVTDAITAANKAAAALTQANTEAATALKDTATIAKATSAVEKAKAAETATDTLQKAIAAVQKAAAIADADYTTTIKGLVTNATAAQTTAMNNIKAANAALTILESTEQGKIDTANNLVETAQKAAIELADAINAVVKADVSTVAKAEAAIVAAGELQAKVTAAQNALNAAKTAAEKTLNQNDDAEVAKLVTTQNAAVIAVDAAVKGGAAKLEAAKKADAGLVDAAATALKAITPAVEKLDTANKAAAEALMLVVDVKTAEAAVKSAAAAATAATAATAAFNKAKDAADKTVTKDDDAAVTALEATYTAAVKVADEAVVAAKTELDAAKNELVLIAAADKAIVAANAAVAAVEKANTDAAAALALVADAVVDATNVAKMKTAIELADKAVLAAEKATDAVEAATKAAGETANTEDDDLAVLATNKAEAAATAAETGVTNAKDKQESVDPASKAVAEANEALEAVKTAAAELVTKNAAAFTALKDVPTEALPTPEPVDPDVETPKTPAELAAAAVTEATEAAGKIAALITTAEEKVNATDDTADNAILDGLKAANTNAQSITAANAAILAMQEKAAELVAANQKTSEALKDVSTLTLVTAAKTAADAAAALVAALETAEATAQTAVDATINKADNTLLDAWKAVNAVTKKTVETNSAATKTAGVFTADANKVEGTANDDVFNADSGTLNAGDTVDGKGGNNTLNVALTKAFEGFGTDTPATGFMKNVQNVVLTNTVTPTTDPAAVLEFSAKNIEGATNYTLNGAVNLADLATAKGLTVNVNDRAKADLTIEFAADAVKGTDDTLALNLNKVGTAKVGETVAQVVAVTTTGIENLTLGVTGDNFVSIANAATKTITATGAGSLDIKTAAAGLTAFDAAGVAGKVTADLTTADATGIIKTIKTGAGDDVVIADIKNLAINTLIDGGAGNDRLQLINTAGSPPANTITQYQMSNVETVALGALGGTLTFSAAKSTGINTLEAMSTLDKAVIFAGMGAGALTFNLVGATAATTGGAITADQTGAATVSVTASKDATVDAPEVNKVAVTLTKSTSLVLDIAEKTAYAGTITASQATSVVSTGTLGNTADAATLMVSNATTGQFTTAEASTLVLKADKMTSLNLDAAKGFTLHTGSSLAKLQTLKVATGGAFLVTAPTALAAIKTVDITGFGSTDLSGVTLGASNLANGINVTAAGSSLKLGDIKVGANQAINLNVADVLGNVTLGGASVAAAAGKATGSITINANGTLGDLTLGALTAHTVTVNAASLLGSIKKASDTAAVEIAADVVNFTGSELNANAITVAKAVDKGSITFTGGAGADTLTITGEITDKDVTKITFNGGSSDDTLVFTAAADLTASTLALNSVEEIKAEAGLTINATQSVQLKDIAITGASSDPAVTIKIGATETTAVGTKLADTFVLTGAEKGVNITGFTIAADSIQGFGKGVAAGTQTLGATNAIIVFAGTAANAAAAATFLQAQNTETGVKDIAAVDVAETAGTAAATFAFVKGTTTTIFSYNNTDKEGKFLESELKLIGTVTSDVALTADDFVAQF